MRQIGYAYIRPEMKSTWVEVKLDLTMIKYFVYKISSKLLDFL